MSKSAEKLIDSKDSKPYYRLFWLLVNYVILNKALNDTGTPSLSNVLLYKLLQTFHSKTST